MEPLRGRHVTIEPMTDGDIQPLWGCVDDTVRQWWPRRLATPDDLRLQCEMLMGESTTEAYTLRDPSTGDVAGATTFYDISHTHRHASIGWTFIGAPWRRTGLNTDAKRLLLTEAFDGRDMLRVHFDVDARNERSQAAVERIGAKREGQLRQHKILHDGFVRDTVIFGITSQEWPHVRRRLDALIHQER